MAVLNKYHNGNRVPQGSVSIMRGSDFGNPFKVGDDGSRDEVVEKYRVYLWSRIKTEPAFRKKVADLYGRDLCCCCAPANCHGFVLEKAAASLHSQFSDTSDGPA